MQFYIDPKSGKIFRSMKDVHRYLDSEELGSLEKKLKGSSHEDLEYDETSVSTFWIGFSYFMFHLIISSGNLHVAISSLVARAVS